MKIDEMYITLEKNHLYKIRIYEIQEGHVFLKRDKTLHIGISSLPEWWQYVKDTSLQISPKIGNIFKIPYKLVNLVKINEPAPYRKDG